MILTLGILGLILCPVCAPFAWFMGWQDLAAMGAGRMDPEGRGLTQAGMILGIVEVALYGFAALIVGGFVVFTMVMAALAPH